MKTLYNRISLVVMAAMMLAACGAGAAHAGVLTQNFVSDNNQVFQVENALSVEKVAGAVNVTYINGSTLSFGDATGAVYNKILNSPGFYGHFYQIGGTLIHMNTTVTSQILCYSGGTQTAFAYPINVQARTFPDNCAAFNAIKAQSN